MKNFLIIVISFQCLVISSNGQINRMHNISGNIKQSSQSNATNAKTQTSNYSNSGFAEKNNVVTFYSGTININSEVVSEMQTEWNTPVNHLGGNFLKVELWLVSYKPDPKNGARTEIILQRPVSVLNSSYRPTPNGVTFSLNSLPAGNNLIVIAYSKKLKSFSGLVLKGKPDDGSGQKIGHYYESNAKSKLGKDIIYGIYSIIPGKTDINNLNFSFAFLGTPPCKNCFSLDDITGVVDDIVEAATKVINGVTYVFDQVVDGVAGLAKLVFENGISLPGFFINEAGQLYYEFEGGLFNLIVFGNLPRERDLTQTEYDFLVNKIFQGADLPAREDIKVFNFMSDSRRAYTIPAPINKVYMNVGDAYDNLIGWTSKSYPAPGQLLVHEFTHAWQIKHYPLEQLLGQGFVNQIVNGGGSSVYNPDCNRGVNGNFNFEQQGAIVDRLYASLYFPDIRASQPCNFNAEWVEKNIKRNVKFDLAGIAATYQMKRHAFDPAISPFVGAPVQDMAIYTKGNPTDGNGYFMTGTVPGSFLYFNKNDKKAFANWGVVRTKFEQLGMESGPLGWPVGDQMATPRRPGSFQYFKRGAIYFSPATGAHFLTGEIQKKWNAMGYENSSLGFPKTDPENIQIKKAGIATDGAGTYQAFENGAIFMSSQFTVAGGRLYSAIVMFNNLLGAWKPDYGFPKSDQASLAAKPASQRILGQFASPAFDSIGCASASIYWSNALGTHVVSGAILDLYLSLGGTNSALGLPISDEMKSTQNSNQNKLNINAGAYYQKFQGGTISYSNGRTTVEYQSSLNYHEHTLEKSISVPKINKETQFQIKH